MFARRTVAGLVPERSLSPSWAVDSACGNDRGALGADHIAWDTITAALREIGYDGAVVIDSFTPDNQPIAHAAAIWRHLAETQDALAPDGLAFLQRVLA